MISSDRPPKAIATLEDRLRSRFGSGSSPTSSRPTSRPASPSCARRPRASPSKAPDDVLELIATHINDNIRELEGALIRVLAFASLNRVPLTLELAESVLGDLITAKAAPARSPPSSSSRPPPRCSASPSTSCAARAGSRPLVTARQVGMYVLREMTDFSYPAIGREFGGRDHTTVMHAVSKIADLMRERRTIYEQVTELMHRIRNAGS